MGNLIWDLFWVSFRVACLWENYHGLAASPYSEPSEQCDHGTIATEVAIKSVLCFFFFIFSLTRDVPPLVVDIYPIDKLPAHTLTPQNGMFKKKYQWNSCRPVLWPFRTECSWENINRLAASSTLTLRNCVFINHEQVHTLFHFFFFFF